MGNDYRRGQRLRAKDVNSLVERTADGGQVPRGIVLGTRAFSNDYVGTLAPSLACKVMATYMPFSVLALQRSTNPSENKGVYSSFRVGTIADPLANNFSLYTNAHLPTKDGKQFHLYPITQGLKIRVIAAETTLDEPKADKMDGLTDADVLPKCGDVCGPIHVDGAEPEEEGDPPGPGRTIFSKTRGGFVCVGDGVELSVGGAVRKMIDVILPALPIEFWGNMVGTVDFSTAEGEFTKCTLDHSAGSITRWCWNGGGKINNGTYNGSAVGVWVNHKGFFYDIRQILGCPT
jgi:hypothetical protein